MSEPAFAAANADWTAIDVALAVVVAVVVAASMEPWARMLHGRVWHGVLHFMHRSHHEPRRGRFERNDVLSAVHAPIATTLVVVGCQLDGFARAGLIGAGVGMTLFGVGYVVVHDGLVHERLRVPALSRWSVLRRIRGAHLVHHRTGGPPFGLFRGPHELKRLRRARRARGEGPSAASGSARAP